MNCPYVNPPLRNRLNRCDLLQAWAASNWVNKGCPKEKLLIGLSSYGYAYHLSSAESHDIGSPVIPKTAAGDISGEPGILAYYEVSRGA